MKRVELPKGPSMFIIPISTINYPSDEMIAKYEQQNEQLSRTVEQLVKVVQPILDQEEQEMKQQKLKNKNARYWKKEWKKK
jgi:uncharacterized protein YdcH (DUF465 family)